MAKKKAKRKTAKKKAIKRSGVKKQVRSAKKVQRKPARSIKRAKPQAAQVQPQTPPPPKVGSFVWHELVTPDTSRAKDFYSRLFGWKMQDDEIMPGFIYTMISNKGDMLGGMMAIAPEQGDVKPHWMIYISVRDVDTIAQQCEEMGGEIIVPAHDIPVGRWALLKDPTGAQFAVYKSAKK